MPWRYRVMKHDEGASEPPYLAIHEVYDDPPGWTTNPVSVGGESIEELREVLIMMRRALAEPVLDYNRTPEPPPGAAKE